MAAGQGFKTFTSGEVLTAADVNGYLMQGVGVFTDAANRNAEITSPQEGQFAYLKDTNVTTYYTGSAWANLDTTGMTNPMTTTGDTIYSSSGSTPARLGIGSTGQVLTVAGGVPTWATAGGGGKVLQVVSAVTGTITTIATTTPTDTTITATITPTSSTSKILVIVQASVQGQKSAGRFDIGADLLRGSTNIQNFGRADFLSMSANGATLVRLKGTFPITCLDSPATTSATTYKIQGSTEDATHTATWQNGVNSVITLLEIGA